MKAKILIVDDELAIRKLLARYLEDAGYECHLAENVASAKKALASTSFDLLLSDIEMPGGGPGRILSGMQKSITHILAGLWLPPMVRLK